MKLYRLLSEDDLHVQSVQGRILLADLVKDQRKTPIDTWRFGVNAEDNLGVGAALLDNLEKKKNELLQSNDNNSRHTLM